MDGSTAVWPNILQNRYRRWIRRCGIALFAATLSACSEQSGNSLSADSAAAQQNLYRQFADVARDLATRVKLTAPTAAQNAERNGFLHPDAPLETWTFLAIIRDQDENHYALQQRFATLHIGSEITETSSSAWAYSQVVAIDYQIDHLASGQRDSHTAAQRVALGLAGVSMDEKKIWLGAFAAQDLSASSCRPFIELKSPELELQMGFRDSESAGCAAQDSPAVDQVATFSFKQSAALPVSGQISVNNQSITLVGHGWLNQGWGIPPDASNAAVVFDRTWLVLDDQHEVQVQRSKRVSGRGPRITTASLHKLGVQGRNDSTGMELDAQLIDDETQSVNQLPVSWRLESATGQPNLRLTPIGDTASVSALTEKNWFGVVSIDGTHRGYGFVDYNLH